MFLQATKKLSEIVKIPVVLIGGIRDIDTMEEILNSSNIRYFGIVRPLILRYIYFNFFFFIFFL